jgi:hypothetical protein
MDYNIKFEYKGIGKQASGIRQKVLRSQKTTGTKTGQTASASRESVNNLRQLNSSILKLIASNKDLARTISKASGSGFGGGRPGGGGGGGGPSFGGMGASIPILGAGIAALGFTIQKVNQIGNAYIEKTSQQIGSVGVGGFRPRGQGVYTAAQIGAGMKAYGTATGRFSRGAQAPQAALDVGAIYGLSPEETLRTAGQFKRTGANYQQAVDVALGGGIESELPTLLTGMASILTDAVREGVNTSNMSEDMARDIAAITNATQGKSVDAAMNIIKSFQGVQKQVAGGKMGTVEGLYTAKASQQLLMERLTGKGKEEYIDKLQKEGYISDKQAKNIRGLKEDAAFEDLQQMAPGASFYLTRQTAAETGTPKLQRKIMENVKKKFGTGAEGLQQYTDYMLQTGSTLSQSQIKTMWDTKDIPVGSESKGFKDREKMAEDVEGGVAGKSVKRIQKREELLIKRGKAFADASLKMEKAMIDLAEGSMDAAVKGIKSVGSAMQTLTGLIDTLNKKIEGSKDKKGEISFSKLLGLPSIFQGN